MKLECVFLPWRSLALNLAAEEYLLRVKEKNEKIIYLFFYENFDSIVLGKTLDIKKEIYEYKNHPNVLRRISGGGSVVHFHGNLNYAVFISLKAHPELFDVKKSYEFILSALITGLNDLLFLSQKGLSDLSLKQRGSLRKISGNSQSRKMGWILHHGTFLYHKTNLNKISYFLKHPPKEPQYRNGRSHSEFMPLTLSVWSKNKIIKGIIKGFSKVFLAPVKRMEYHEFFNKNDINEIRKLTLKNYMYLK